MKRSMNSDAWPYEYFSRAEMACSATNECFMVPSFMFRLARLREAVDAPLPVSSGYRSPLHPREIAKVTTSGAHTLGLAVDIAVSGELAVRVLRVACDMRFTGIGISQRGAGRFIHLDDAPPGTGRPRPHLWSY